ncbi:cytochrome P450 [Lipomyces tetrasporus]
MGSLVPMLLPWYTNLSCSITGVQVLTLRLKLSPEAHLVVLQSRVYDFPKPAMTKAYKIIIGNGLVFAEGQEHKHQRKLMSPAFSYAHVKKFVPVFMSKTKKVMNQFDKIVETGPTVFEVFSYFSRLTLDAIGEASFGIDLNSIEDENSELVRTYDKIANAGEKFFLFNMFAFLPGWKYVPTKYNNEIRHAHKVFSATCKKVLAEKQNRLKSTDNVSDKDGVSDIKDRDILSILLGSSDWSAEMVEHQIMTFLFAGHETTAGAVAWALLTLAKHMDVQEKLRAEVRDAFPGGVDDIKTADQIESLKYTNNVMRELMRVNPPVISTARESSQDIVIDGETIYKGTMLNISIKGLNYSKKLWGPDTYEFNPDRWDGRQADNAYAYMTFLQGTRACIGRRFAEIEFKCILASFVGRYLFEESVENQPINREFAVTVRPTDGLPLKVSKIDGW